MPHAFGYRARTRHTFKRPFKQHGVTKLTKYLTTYKVGDYVDIRVDGAIQKGMAFKYYHGRTGMVFNVTPRALGVIVNKQVSNRIIPKRIHVRIEHVQKSRCKQAFIDRITHNDQLKHEGSLAGKHISTKRIPGLPKAGHIVKTSKTTVETVTPLPYTDLI
eukprot:c17893_g1_i1.p1 GENE.c17893_g1_i1~~c17893_g1_i1.p1  ORF type:complete len:161 (-),score=15.35 c17893_g1_i1:119-601(-)